MQKIERIYVNSFQEFQNHHEATFLFKNIELRLDLNYNFAAAFINSTVWKITATGFIDLTHFFVIYYHILK